MDESIFKLVRAKINLAKIEDLRSGILPFNYKFMSDERVADLVNKRIEHEDGIPERNKAKLNEIFKHKFWKCCRHGGTTNWIKYIKLDNIFDEHHFNGSMIKYNKKSTIGKKIYEIIYENVIQISLSDFGFDYRNGEDGFDIEKYECVPITEEEFNVELKKVTDLLTDIKNN